MQVSGPNTPLDPYAQQGMQSQYTPATVSLLYRPRDTLGAEHADGFWQQQFFEDFSYWDMDQWDLASMPMGLS